MSRVVESPDGLAIVAGPFRLAFRCDGRRWSHALDLDGRTFAASFEWEADKSADPTRVVSPAYQQLTTQDGSAGVQALAVGQWGHHHFSGVFSVEDGGYGRVLLSIDSAIRTRADLNALSSTYVLPLSSGDLAEADPNAVAWTVPSPPGGTLRFEAGDPGVTLSLAEAGRQATRVQALATLRPGQATQRLAYRWTWTPADRVL